MVNVFLLQSTQISIFSNFQTNEKPENILKSIYQLHLYPLVFKLFLSYILILYIL